MKSSSKILAVLTLTALAISPALVHAQDAPPPPDGYAAPGPDGGAPPPDAGGDQGASFQEFYDQLGSQGTWVQTDNYGYAFQPNVEDPNWAPYSDGHWVYTDVGWTWASDEPWGWATYHYGRWVNIDGTGWCWVPGYEWAPAWVSWRYGGGYCGWAPLPPASFVGVEFGGPGVAVGLGFHFGGDVDLNFGIGAGCYNFLPVGYLGDSGYRGHYLDRGRNFTVINNTTNITNININNGTINRGGAGANFRRVNVGGPTLAEVNAQSHTHIQQVQLAQAGQPGRSSLNGNTLSVYAPRVNAATMHSARPTRVAATLGKVQVNRGENISNLPAVNSRVRPTAATPEAISAARQAQASAPATAHIAREGMAPRKTLTTPLSRMTPIQRETRAPATAATHAANAAQAQTEHQQGEANRQTEIQANTQKTQQEDAARREQTQSEERQRTQDAAAVEEKRTTAAQEERTRSEAAEKERTDAAQQERERTEAAQQHTAAAQEEREHATSTGQEQREHAAAVTQEQREHAASQSHAPAPQQHAAAQGEKPHPAPAAEKGKDQPPGH